MKYVKTSGFSNKKESSLLRLADIEQGGVVHREKEHRKKNTSDHFD